MIAIGGAQSRNSKTGVMDLSPSQSQWTLTWTIVETQSRVIEGMKAGVGTMGEGETIGVSTVMISILAIEAGVSDEASEL